MVFTSIVTKTRVYETGGELSAANYNDDRDEIISGVNDIVNAQVNASAAIAQSKLAGTWPSSGIIVGTTDTQTLTNKTLTSPTVNTPTMAGTVATITTATDEATVTFNLNNGPIHSVTLGGNRTLALSNSAVGKVFVIRLVQDATGSRTVTWFSTIRWPGGTAPTLSTGANDIDVFGFICVATNTYEGFIVGQDMA